MSEKVKYFCFTTSGLESYALAQHCFIKSIEVEPNVWTANLHSWLVEVIYSLISFFFSCDLFGFRTECCRMDKPWYAVFNKGQHRGAVVTFFTCQYVGDYFHHWWLTFLLNCAFLVLACAWSLQNCTVFGATVCQLLDWSGTVMFSFSVVFWFVSHNRHFRPRVQSQSSA